MSHNSQFFALGLSAGLAQANWIADAAAAILDAGIVTPDAYKAARAEWVKGYAKGFGCTEKRAENAWAIAYKETSLPKPQSERAKKVQAARAASKPVQDASVVDVEAKEVTPPVTGIASAARVTREVSALEAHLLAKIKAGQFATAHEILRAMEAAFKPTADTTPL